MTYDSTQKARTIKHGSEIASPAHRKAGLEPLMAAIAERLCRIDIETRRLEDRETDLTKSIGQLRGADGSLYITLAHHTSKGVLAADQTIESRNKVSLEIYSS